MISHHIEKLRIHLTGKVKQPIFHVLSRAVTNTIFDVRVRSCPKILSHCCPSPTVSAGCETMFVSVWVRSTENRRLDDSFAVIYHSLAFIISRFDKVFCITKNFPVIWLHVFRDFVVVRLVLNANLLDFYMANFSYCSTNFTIFFFTFSVCF